MDRTNHCYSIDLRFKKVCGIWYESLRFYDFHTLLFEYKYKINLLLESEKKKKSIINVVGSNCRIPTKRERVCSRKNVILYLLPCCKNLSHSGVYDI